MISTGLFTKSDLVTINKAACLAEKLTQDFFRLPDDEWKREPYGIFTRKEINEAFHERDVFANVIRYKPAGRLFRENAKARYGIVLQDPNILMALFRSSRHDLWSLILFILTHELVHIVRFSRFQVDFFAPASHREKEEKLVREMTREILAGVSNIDYIIDLYANSNNG